jgi:hypothetical protein
MAANVRCTNANVWTGGALRTCGWRGERFPTLDLAGTNWREAPAVELKALEDAARVAKRCPRCGGRVELIERESA